MSKKHFKNQLQLYSQYIFFFIKYTLKHALCQMILDYFYLGLATRRQIPFCQTNLNDDRGDVK